MVDNFSKNSSSTITLTIANPPVPPNNGGGSGIVTSSYIDILKGESKTFLLDSSFRFRFNNSEYQVTLTRLDKSSATIKIEALNQKITPKISYLRLNETDKFELNSDNYYDVSVKLKEIIGLTASLYFVKINETISSPIVSVIRNETVVRNETQYVPQINNTNNTIVNETNQNVTKENWFTLTGNAIKAKISELEKNFSRKWNYLERRIQRNWQTIAIVAGYVLLVAIIAVMIKQLIALRALNKKGEVPLSFEQPAFNSY